MDIRGLIPFVVLIYLARNTHTFPALHSRLKEADDAVLQRVARNAFGEAIFGVDSVDYFEETGEYFTEQRSISETDLKKLRYVFRGIDLSNTQFGKILKTGEAGDEFWRETAHTWSSFNMDEDDLQRTLEQLVTSRRLDEHDADLDPVKEREPFTKDGGEDTDYEECRKDYSSTVEPITDRIIYLIHSAICDENPLICIPLGNLDPPDRNMSSWNWNSMY